MRATKSGGGGAVGRWKMCYLSKLDTILEMGDGGKNNSLKGEKTNVWDVG